MNIEVKNLSYSYKKGTDVLSSATFTLSSVDMVAILGKNGAGKSTLFKLLLKSLKKETGEILIDGKSIDIYKIKDIATVLSYIPQSGNMEFSYTVLDAILMGSVASLSMFSYPKEKEIDEAIELLKTFKILNLKDRRMDSLSGGERQMVLILRALMQKSSFIILDEPTSNLDYGNQIMLLNELRKLNESGIGIIYSTHNPELALNYSNKILTIKDGKIKTFSSPEDLAQSRELSEIYNEELFIKKIDTGRSMRYICTPL